MRRYEVDEILLNESITLFSELKSKDHSVGDYDGNNWNGDSSNMFQVSEDGQVSISSNGNAIYLENWNQPIDSTNRVIKLPNEMDNNIRMVNVDFNRNLVISGDERGYLLIQRISQNEILLPKTKIFEDSHQPISCSSILNNFLCVGNDNCSITTIDLESFCRIKELTFQYGYQYISSLNICENENKNFVIVSGKFNL